MSRVSVNVSAIGGKKLLCAAGPHTVITDRKAADGGTDAGCTSGELLLLAIGSCATGSIRNDLLARGLSAQGLSVEVAFEPSPQANARDVIAITVSLPQAMLDAGTAPIKAAAIAGGVVSRIRLGSVVDVCCQARADQP